MHILYGVSKNIQTSNAYNSYVNKDGTLYFAGIGVECCYMIMRIS
jgi:hypothetical protein